MLCWLHIPHCWTSHVAAQLWVPSMGPFVFEEVPLSIHNMCVSSSVRNSKNRFYFSHYLSGDLALFVRFLALRPSQQLWSWRDGQFI